MKKLTSFTLCLLWAMSLVWAGWAQSTTPPEGIDFSSLTEDNPQTELSLTSGYKGSLETTWHSLYSNSAVKWAGVYSDQWFACSASNFSVKAPYSSYLVTAPLQLEAIGGKSLTFDLKVNSTKGTSPFRILLINKSGETLETLYEHQYEKQDFTPTQVTMPEGLSGVGFIAFVNQGSQGNFASYNLKKITLKSSSTEVAISYNPSDGLTFSEVAAGEVGATKELEVFIQNFSGTPEATLTGINKEDFILRPIAGGLTATGGKLQVTFVPKNGNSNISASVTIKAGKKQVDIPLSASASGAHAAIKVSATPESLDFGSVAVGETSVQMATSITVQNAITTPTVTLTGTHKGDFAITMGASFDNHGGGISVTFTPTAEGTRTASIEVNASGTLLEIPIRGNGIQGGGVTPEPSKPEPQEDKELLADQFFYNFDEADRPTSWSYKGNVTKETKGYNSSTGFAVRLDQTASEETAQLYQEIDIDAVDYSMASGSVLEGMIHYSVQEPFAEGHGVRLACQWLDAEHQPIATPEDAFIASDRYIEWRKAWDEVRFRTVVPKGARYFRFGVEVSAGSLVKVDDCSLLRLTALHAQDRFVSVLPHALYREGTTTTPLEGTMLVQSMSNGKVTPMTTAPSGTLTLTPSELPAGNKVTTVSYAIHASEPGAYISGAYGTKPYSVQYDGVNGWATIRINSYIIDATTPPAVKLSDKTPNKLLTCTVGDSDEMELEFDVAGVIQEVKVQTASESGYFKSSTSSFFYSPTQKKVLNNKIKITFAPRKAGTYTATLTLTTACMEPLVLTLTGEAQEETAEWMETFAEEKAKDPRFTGDNWARYHRFDKGYYYLDGSWEEASKVAIDQGGCLESDELLVNGIASIKLLPASAALELHYTIDGGGHWTKAILEGDTYKLGTHRPTRFKVVNGSSQAVVLEKILLVQSPAEERESIKEIAKAMTLVDTKEAQGLIEEYFDTQRHTRGVSLAGWQSFATLADRPFKGWEQKNKSTQKVEETCAQISFFNSLDKEDAREQEAWLITPLLSKAKAQSMHLTFRLRYELPTQDGKEQFGVYILTPEGEQGIKTQFIDISKQLLVPQIEPDKWYDYCIDLSQLEGVTIEDCFYVAFTMYSPVGGTKTSLTFMVDDVTFGRTDLPVITTTTDQVSFIFKPNVPCPPQTIQVSVTHPSKAVTISLEPSRLAEEFKVSPLQLPAEGGELAVGFSTKKERSLAAALLLQTRGGVSKLVRLLAQRDNAVESLEPLTPVHLYPTVATTKLHLSVTCQRYWIYTVDGALVLGGGACSSVDISSLAPAQYYIRIEIEDGGVATLPFSKK